MTRSRTALVAACLGALSTPAYAHFKLNAPVNRSEQDSLGSPQKSGPCGMTDSSTTPDQSVPTNVVTPVRAGSTLTISINELVFHPGHYRVALAKDMASLPADPPVTPGSTPCGTTVIAASPTLPLLGDGLLMHTTSTGGATQTMQVQIPAGMTCTNCVLQVIQFMSDHQLNNPGGCFYHHCAIVNVSPDAQDPGPGPGTGSGSGDGSNTPGSGVSGGCSIAPGQA
ncbi:MAG TPA: SCE4755 family polysaccharide monooxygenase-like protein, partial [Kofleriaceae bacterium]|nr:SCE4755 family polysaccharide monooxygenase-like protein [Kofleriaceae bacterium]